MKQILLIAGALALSFAGPALAKPGNGHGNPHGNAYAYGAQNTYGLQNAYGVNGAKYRLCRHLIATAVVEQGVDAVVTAQSVRSPQAAITATLCEEMGLDCYVVVGASKPETT